jgi:hypothetical protein
MGGILFLFNEIVRFVLRLTLMLVEALLHVFKALIGRRTSPRARWRLQATAMTARERVLRIDRVRQRKGYRPGWLYYRCREEGLLEAYEGLVAEGKILGEG